MPMDTVTISPAAKRASRPLRKPLTRLPGMGFIGWTFACLRDLFERGTPCHCPGCDIECPPELGICDECAIQEENRAIDEAREYQQSKRDGLVAHLRR